LGSKYWKEGRADSFKQSDERARQILQACFPKHQIYQFDTEILNLSGGGIHCITQQQPFVRPQLEEIPTHDGDSRGLFCFVLFV